LSDLLQVHKLHIKVDTSPEKIKKFWKCRNNAFDLYRDLFRAKADNIDEDDGFPVIEIEEEQGESLNLTKRFEKWQAGRQNEFFCELDDLTCLKFFSRMNITYQVVAKIEDEEKYEDLSKSIFSFCSLYWAFDLILNHLQLPKTKGALLGFFYPGYGSNWRS
jgi:hypothetical protein